MFDDVESNGTTIKDITETLEESDLMQYLAQDAKKDLRDLINREVMAKISSSH